MKKDISKCCKAEVELGGMGDFHYPDTSETRYYVCKKCKRACDVAVQVIKSK